MARLLWLFAPLITFGAASANAADTKLILNGARTDYSGAYGKRMITTFESTTDFGATTLTLGGSHGKREFLSTSASAFRLSGIVHHDWTERFFTRTSIAVSSNKPVFATREFAQDLNFKPLAHAVLTVGGKYARYFDKREALSWSAGGAYYFPLGSATYRFTAYDVSRLGKSHSHLASFRIKDGKGLTQLWLGTGTSLHDQELLSVSERGKFRSVAIQRVQPLAGPLSVSLGLGRTWYQTESDRYRGTSVTFGLTVDGIPKL